MMRSWRYAVAVGVIGLVGLAACGDDEGDETASTTTTTEAASPFEGTAAAPTTLAVTTTTEAESPFKATATPTEGLKAGDPVEVSVSGFTAGKTLGINECAQKGDADVGAEDCDLGGIVTLEVAADGTGSGTINVKDTAIGSNNHDCHDPDTRCFLSVGELSADPNAERSDDIDLTFG